MTICFKGSDCKYEIEAVMKLFIPVQSFDFRFDEKPPESGFALIARENGRLFVKVNYLGRTLAAEEKDSDDFELRLCRMLFTLMRDITGIDPEWGCMTGIRPVKKVNELLRKGLSKEEIFPALREKYLVSDNKLELAYLTAKTQEKLLYTEDNSFSLYVSVPFCPSRCAYCSFVSHSIESPSAKKLLPEYVNKLCDELELTARIAEECGLSLDTVYIGGGTPTSLSAEELDKIMKKIGKSFDISRLREYTVEAGRPDTITPEKLRAIKENGATRLSVNPQTMNDSVLCAIGRKHTAGDFIDAFEEARRAGFDNINADTIAGLPTDTPESLENTLETLCTMGPESITLHTLTFKRSSRLFNSGGDNASFSGLPEAVSRGQELLLSHGYFPYYLYRQKNTLGNLENTGFAKKGKESLYNIFIMDEEQTILAAGAGGSTKLVDRRTGRIERVFNYKFPYEYISRYGLMTEKKLSAIKKWKAETS